MISICIPIYNCDVRDLVKSLNSQCKEAKIEYEIILIDDCSTNSFRKINSELHIISNYVELDQNVGRAKIRNLFLQYVRYDYLLFLDCDSIIISSDFIKNYVNIINENLSVVVGGRVYPSERPKRNKLLRWKYCNIRERKPNNNASNEKKHFLSNNFLIKKSIFENIKFNEKITNYGHEDTLFGYELKKAGVEVSYINNPVLNGELEDNGEFLEKTERSIENLKLILEILNYDVRFINEVNLLRNYYKLKKYKLDFLIYVIWKIKRTLIKFLLKNGISSLILFDFYKLGYLISIMQKSSKTISP